MQQPIVTWGRVIVDGDSIDKYLTRFNYQPEDFHIVPLANNQLMIVYVVERQKQEVKVAKD